MAVKAGSKACPSMCAHTHEHTHGSECSPHIIASLPNSSDRCHVHTFSFMCMHTLACANSALCFSHTDSCTSIAFQGPALLTDKSCIFRTTCAWMTYTFLHMFTHILTLPHTTHIPSCTIHILSFIYPTLSSHTHSLSHILPLAHSFSCL